MPDHAHKPLKALIIARKNLGLNTRAHRQALALARAGHGVTVIALAPPDPGLRAQAPEVEYLEVRVEPSCFRIWKKLRAGLGRNNSRPAPAVNNSSARPSLSARQANIPRRLLSSLAHMLELRELARQSLKLVHNRNFDIVQSHDLPPLPAALALARKTGAALVLDLLEIPNGQVKVSPSPMIHWLGPLENRMRRKAIRRAKLVLAVGPGAAQAARQTWGIASPAIVRNCALYREPGANPKIRLDLGLGPDQKLGLVIGAVYRGQGIENIIRAMPLMDPKIHIGLIGPEAEPGYFARLTDLAQKTGVESRFRVIPLKPPSQLIDYVSGADFGLIARRCDIPNNAHCLPNKLFEMIMARLPIGAGRLEDVNQLMAEHEIGLVFDQNDPADIARTANRLALDQPLVQTLRAGLDKAARALCWENEGAGYVELLENIVRGETS